MNKNTVAAIDFGTSKIVTLVAENSNSQRCDIIGNGIAVYDGYLEEGWNNPGELEDAIRTSIEQAEKQSKHKIRSINVGVPGEFIKVYATEVTLELTGNDPRVTPEDVKNAFKRAAEELSDLPGAMIHSSPAWFMVDNGKKTLEPVGLKGRELKALISFVTASRFFVDELNNRMANMGITVSGFYSTPSGEAMLYLPEEDRDRTAVLIDIGYLNTEVMVMEGDAMLFHQNIDMGGGYMAADLAEGLDIPLESAERIKREYVYGMATGDATYSAGQSAGQKPLTFERERVAEVLEARVDELADEIKRVIEESGVRLGGWSNIYLTGGGLAFNRGGREYLANRLERPVRDIPKRTTKLNNHSMSSALGLMDLIIDTVEQQSQSPNAVAAAFKNFFRNLFG